MSRVTTISKGGQNERRTTEKRIGGRRGGALSLFQGNDKIKSSAFTLAEVLITLGIIGIVAALTIPTLVQSYKRKIVETRVVNFVSNISNAFKMATIDNGEFSSWELGSNEDHRNSELMENFYNTYLKPYMRDVKTTVKASVETTSISGNGIFDIYLNDGSVVRIYYIRSNNFAFFYYPKGMSDNIKNFKSYGNGGEDYFSFTFYQNISNGAINAYYQTGTYKNYTHDDWLKNCINVAANSRASSCTMLLQINNWKIPEDYPYKL